RRTAHRDPVKDAVRVMTRSVTIGRPARPAQSRLRGDMSKEELRRGDLVEVKSPSEILATLDQRGALADLPFMPEMAPFCGRRFTVERRAEKICDTIHYTGSRRLHGAVLLEDLRCDSSAHDGCQAECRFFW